MNQEPNEGGGTLTKICYRFFIWHMELVESQEKKNDTKISLDTKTRISKIFELLLKQQKQDLW